MLPWNILTIGNFDGEINNVVSISVAIADGYDTYGPDDSPFSGMHGLYYLVKMTTYVHKDYKCIYYCILSCTFSIWAGKLYWLDNVLLYTVTDRNITFFSDTFVTCYLLRVGNLIVHPVHLLLTENIKRGNQGIIIYFYYLIQNINVNGLMCFFLQDKHNINTVS